MLLEMLATRNLDTNANGKLKQNVRNALKNEITEQFAEFLKQNGVENVRVKEGLILEFTNENLGAIPVVVNLVMKDLEFDVMTAENEYIAYIKDKEAKALAKAKAKEKAD